MRRAIRLIAIALNIALTIVWAWLIGIMLYPPFFQRDDIFVGDVYVNPLVLPIVLAPISALAALLWREKR